LPAAVVAIVVVTRVERIETAESKASEVTAIVVAVAVETSGRKIAAGRSEIVRRPSEVTAGAGEIARTGRPREARTDAAVSHCGTTAKSTTAMGHRGTAATAHVTTATAAAAESSTAATAMVLRHRCCRDRRRAQNRGGRNCHHTFAHDFRLPVQKTCARD
jgi:hypothetical protein